MISDYKILRNYQDAFKFKFSLTLPIFIMPFVCDCSEFISKAVNPIIVMCNYSAGRKGFANEVGKLSAKNCQFLEIITKTTMVAM